MTSSFGLGPFPPFSLATSPITPGTVVGSPFGLMAFPPFLVGTSVPTPIVIDWDFSGSVILPGPWDFSGSTIKEV